MSAFINFCKTNPVRAMVILQALIVCAVAFGAHLTGTQITAVTTLAAAVLGLGGELVRSSVTPMATLPDKVAAAISAQQDATVPKVATIVPDSAIVVPASAAAPTSSTTTEQPSVTHTITISK